MAVKPPAPSAGEGPSDVDAAQALESGSRNGQGFSARLLLGVLLSWSLFQLWIASPLPFIFNVGIFNATEARAVHLAFALFLAFTLFPARFSAPGQQVPWYDWLLAVAAATASVYLFVFAQELAGRAGAPIARDLVMAGIGMVLLLTACRRVLGWPLAIVALVFLAYTYLGPHMPDVIAHRGASLRRIATHQWLSSEGVFGVALGVSVGFVFLFVLFGSLLERAGAGQYFIAVAYSLLGHMRGGPAKAAVVSSGLSGVISGSSIANVVTTGTFTIPLMKRVGFPATKAGAVEVAASTTGQLTPPIMGAAAFLIAESVGVSYIDVVRHALLPALLSYIGLLYIVHLEACKQGLEGLPRGPQMPWVYRLLVWLTLLIGLLVLTLVVYHGLGWLKQVAPEQATVLVALGLGLTYLGLLRYAVRFPVPDPATMDVQLPPVAATVKSGLHFLLPLVVLIWCLTVERLSPQLSAFWATVFLLLIVLTQRPLAALFRRERALWEACGQGLTDAFQGLVRGARNMVGIGIATATAGIIVGTVTLTGIGLVMTELVELVSGGHLLLMLLFTALVSLILGLGLPTTANYIVVSSLMAPVIVTLGAESGLLVPLIAVHLFVFYFGILADATPPVGLAAYAAAAISRADPIKTGIQGFMYDIRTAVLPFMFLFNTQLLLIGLGGWWDLFFTIVSATAAMLLFAAATQGYWLVRSKRWESALLLLLAFSLFRPDFWWDPLFPARDIRPGSELFAATEALPGDAPVEVVVRGETLDRGRVSRHMELTLPAHEGGEQRWLDFGVELVAEGQAQRVDFIVFASDADDSPLEFDWEIIGIVVPQERPSPRWLYLPLVLLLGGVAWNQRRRRQDQAFQAGNSA
ncbi:MAG: TRAP transporter fused permease subunit [Halomonadaceae bacterium]|nr:MAG: TRAP transporter fused permease subunit [Halomonadaceae bacterium]